MSPQRIALLLVAAGSLVGPRQASPQAIAWTETSTIGYGLLAGAAGLAVCLEVCGLDEASLFFAVLTPTVVGSVLGHQVGAGAERTARAGDRPSSAQLWGVRVGMVAAGAGLGSLVAAVRIDREGGNAPGDDERMLRNYAIGGAVLGVLAEVLQENALGVSRSSSFEVTRRPGGALGGGLKLVF